MKKKWKEEVQAAAEDSRAAVAAEEGSMAAEEGSMAAGEGLKAAGEGSMAAGEVSKGVEVRHDPKKICNNQATYSHLVPGQENLKR